MGSDIYSQLLRCSTARGSSTGLFLVGPTKVQQQYQSFPLSCFGLTGLISGQTEPVAMEKIDTAAVLRLRLIETDNIFGNLINKVLDVKTVLFCCT